MSEPRYGFQMPLDIRHLPDGRWMVLKELRYLSALTQKAYTIEAGFEFDGASVPRIPVAYWLTGNTAWLAAVVHDYLYANAPYIETKHTADAIFAEIMDADFYSGGPYDKRSGEPEWRKGLMHFAVSAFGPSHYWGEDGSRKAGFEITEPLGD